jgi:hypothetical protein
MCGAGRALPEGVGAVPASAGSVPRGHNRSTALDPEVLDLLAFWASVRPHSFRTIVYFELEADGPGSAVVLYPRSSAEFVNFDENTLRARRFISIDLRAYRELPNGRVALTSVFPAQSTAS